VSAAPAGPISIVPSSIATSAVRKRIFVSLIRTSGRGAPAGTGTA